jgi:M6 family metalloprotease-like protein
LNRGDASGYGAWDYFNDAIIAADPHVDFSPYDLVYVVPATGARANTSFQTTGFSIADSKNVTYAIELGTDIRSTYIPNNAARVLTHETLHTLGLPDLYDTSKGNYYAATDEGIGGWDIMSGIQPGGHLLAWHKWKLGWLDASQLRCVFPGHSLDVTLTPTETGGGLKAIVIPTGPTTAYVLENRQRTGSDAGLCDTGVLLYRIDAAVGSGGLPIRVVPAHPGTATDAGQNFRCSPFYDAPFDFGSGEVASFSDPAAGLTLQLLSKTPDGSYAIHISRS